MSNLTIVTGIWDLKRHEAGDGFKRPFEHYIAKFKELLRTECYMLIYIEAEHEHIVWSIRDRRTTRVVIKEVDSFKNGFDGYKYVQSIRKNPKWLALSSWLPNSTQASLEYYNPMVMSKMFMLHDAVCHNPFATDHFVWVDGGITNTVHPGYFTHDKILDKIEPYLSKFLFLSFPYKAEKEIHGFEIGAMNIYAGAEVKHVCRGGIFGGHKDAIRHANGMYYNLLIASLAQGYMGTEESIFTIMSYKEPNTFKRFMIEENGMIGSFAEALKNNTVQLDKGSAISTAVYVISFNSPAQFKHLVQSWARNSEFITDTTNYLLDNSTDLSTTDEYIKICAEYNFTHIKKDNLGICGGRQFIAEHFAETEHDYYVFLEDDMNLADNTNDRCKNGFVTYVSNFYETVHAIMQKEKYDFLKFSFTEFFGDNRTQWAWYNVPQSVRQLHWPFKQNLPAAGLDPDAPLTKFEHINSINGLAYADGDVYYCNWPQIVSRVGNQKMFLDTKWAHPFEQTWMSHMFQANDIAGAVLLASPINHHRFDHYASGLRKES